MVLTLQLLTLYTSVKSCNSCVKVSVIKTKKTFKK